VDLKQWNNLQTTAGVEDHFDYLPGRDCPIKYEQNTLVSSFRKKQTTFTVKKKRNYYAKGILYSTYKNIRVTSPTDLKKMEQYSLGVLNIKPGMKLKNKRIIQLLL
jgi:hypothetical protein